jgi:hypothetical protein
VLGGRQRLGQAGRCPYHPPTIQDLLLDPPEPPERPADLEVAVQEHPTPDRGDGAVQSGHSRRKV